MPPDDAGIERFPACEPRLRISKTLMLNNLADSHQGVAHFFSAADLR